MKLSILPLGDSITEGGENHPCYRPFLGEALTEAGWEFEFIGPRTDFRGLRHAGYSGKNTEFIETQMDEILEAKAPDIVLLHSGHNHFIEEKPVGGIVAATESILQKVWQRNPQTVVFLAQVILSGKLPKYSYLSELNAEFAALVKRYVDRPLVLVDHTRNFRWESDALDDMVHPNEQGARKMAATWLESLKRERERLSDPI